VNRKLLMVHSTSSLTGVAGPTLSVMHRAESTYITSVTLQGHPRKACNVSKADHTVWLSRDRHKTPECQCVPIPSRQKLPHLL
jgi:hypothetical protein